MCNLYISLSYAYAKLATAKKGADLFLCGICKGNWTRATKRISNEPRVSFPWLHRPKLGRLFGKLFSMVGKHGPRDRRCMGSWGQKCLVGGFNPFEKH